MLGAAVFGAYEVALTRATALAAASTAADVRTSCLRQAVVELRKLATLPADEAYLRETFHYALDSLNCVRLHTRLLA